MRILTFRHAHLGEEGSHALFPRGVSTFHTCGWGGGGSKSCWARTWHSHLSREKVLARQILGFQEFCLSGKVDWEVCLGFLALSGSYGNLVCSSSYSCFCFSGPVLPLFVAILCFPQPVPLLCEAVLDHVPAGLNIK